MSRSWPLLLSVLATLTLVGAGCGDDESSQPAGATAPSDDPAAIVETSSDEAGPEDQASGGSAAKPLSPAERAAVEQDIERVGECLKEAGVTTQGGFYERGDDADAPDGQLSDSRGTFIAFYASERRADRLAQAWETDTSRPEGAVTRHGRVTVVYVRVAETGNTGEPDQRIEACVAR